MQPQNAMEIWFFKIFSSKSGIFEIFDVSGSDWKALLENVLAQILLSIWRLRRPVFSLFWNIELYTICGSLPNFLRQYFIKIDISMIFLMTIYYYYLTLVMNLQIFGWLGYEFKYILGCCKKECCSYQCSASLRL